MASKKFTDLPVATAADGADILAIVDVSTDTSKQITKENFYKNLIPQGDYVPVVTLNDNAVVATPVIARYTDYGDTVDVRLRVEYEADASAGSMSFLVSTPVGSAATPAIATFNGSNGGDVNFIVARGQGANILIEIVIVPDSVGDFDCVINYKKA
jgi:hypothetical protein